MGTGTVSQLCATFVQKVGIRIQSFQSPAVHCLKSEDTGVEKPVKSQQPTAAGYWQYPRLGRTSEVPTYYDNYEVVPQRY